MVKLLNTEKHNTQDSQDFSHFPAGDHKDEMNIQYIITKTNMTHDKQKGSTKKVPPWNCLQKILEGLNMFDSTSLTLISDVNHDK